MIRVHRWFRVHHLLLLLTFTGVGAAQQAGKDDKKPEVKKPAVPRIQVECESKEAIYKLGDTVKFFFATDTPGYVAYRLTDETGAVAKEGKIPVKPRQTYLVQGKLDKPGFLRIELQQDEGRTFAAAAFEPTKIEPTTKTPADFDAFWQQQVKNLAKVRVEPEIDLILTKSTSTISGYRVKLGFIDGRQVHGWLAVPKGPGPYPAILSLPGAGVNRIEEPDFEQAGLGAMVMSIIIHDIPIDFRQEYFVKVGQNELKDYRRIGWDDRNKCYFRYAILAGVRALDYVTNRKDFNGEVAVTGSSQGGGLTLAVSGLDPRVSLAAPNIAGLCELNGLSHGRVGGWPHWLSSVPADLKAKVEETSPYFDAVNFARKFKGKSLHGVGFLDTVCPPSTVYAAFNVHPEPKRMIANPRLGHAIDPEWVKARDDFWKKHLTLKPPVEKK